MSLKFPTLQTFPTLQRLCINQMTEKDKTLLCLDYSEQFPDFIDEIREKEIYAKDYLVDIFEELYIKQFYAKYYKTMYQNTSKVVTIPNLLPSKVHECFMAKVHENEPLIINLISL